MRVCQRQLCNPQIFVRFQICSEVVRILFSPSFLNPILSTKTTSLLAFQLLRSSYPIITVAVGVTTLASGVVKRPSKMLYLI